MGEMLLYSRPDGQQAPAYHEEPRLGSSAPGVVVIQEWWGINDQMRGVAKRLADAGFRALVPDLYRGRLTAKPDEADHMMQDLDWADATHQDLRGAVQYLHQTGSKKVAVLGFCMGGALTIAAGVHVPEANAGVCFYGIPPKELADPAKIQASMLFHFATNDDWCNAESVATLDRTLKTAGVDYTLHKYEGTQHAFFNEARPEVYDRKSAELAWDRSLEFLRKTIGS